MTRWLGGAAGQRRARLGQRPLSAAVLLLAAGGAPRLSAEDVTQRLLAVPDTAAARQLTADLARGPHMAGTPAQLATRDYVLARMRSWGLEAWAKEYTVYLPHPDTVAAWVLAGPGAPALSLDLREPVVAEDPVTRGPQVPPFNAYTGDGDVTADRRVATYALTPD